jgi:hypothetical protein
MLKIAAFLTLLILSSTSAFAQNANVFYQHGPGAANANQRLSYLEAGERTAHGPSDRHAGQPPQLAIPKGSHICVAIERANPLLYDYKIEGKTVSIAAPEGYGDILAGLVVIVPGMTLPKPQAAGAAIADTAERPYARLIKEIAARGARMDTLKQASDTADAIPFVAIDLLKREVDSLNADADRVYKQGETAKNNVVLQLRVAQVAAKRAVDGIYKEFADAKAAVGRFDPQYCVKIEDTPQKITVTASRKDTTKPAARPVGTLVQFDAEPVSAKTFDVFPIAMVSLAVGDARKFFLDDQSLVRDRPDRGFFPAAGIMASYRVGGPTWIGGAVAKGQTGTPDSFVGVLLRSPSIEKFFIVGVGLAFSSVPASLQEGAVVGKPLPTGSDLTKVIKKEQKAGLGVIFSFSGLSLAK